MSSLGRLVQSWPMLGSIGAGLVLTALAAGAELIPGALLAGCGIAALGWGVLALRAGRPVAARATLGSGAAVLLASAALAGGGAAAGLGIPLLPLFAADLLVAVVALGAAAELRSRRGAAEARAVVERHRGPRPSPGPQSRGLHLAGMLAGAALVAALATPALAATEAGTVAVPHGELHGPSHEH